MFSDSLRAIFSLLTFVSLQIALVVAVCFSDGISDISQRSDSYCLLVFFALSSSRRQICLLTSNFTQIYYSPPQHSEQKSVRTIVHSVNDYDNFFLQRSSMTQLVIHCSILVQPKRIFLQIMNGQL